MATITTRVDDSTKVALYRFAEEIGIPVSSLFNAWAKDLIRRKRITISLDQDTLEDEEMYAHASSLKKQGSRSLASGRSSLVI